MKELEYNIRIDLYVSELLAGVNTLLLDELDKHRTEIDLNLEYRLDV